MIKYLGSDALTKPTTIAAAPETANSTAGLVTSDIGHGELFLHPKGDRSARIRLRWEPGADGARELAPGTYVVTGYRHVAQGDDGHQWIWSATSAGYRQVTVKADATTHVDVRSKLTVRTRAFLAKNGKHRVGLAFVAEKRLGHTLYRDAKRIAITWQCLGADGAAGEATVLAEGAMEYG